MAYQTTTVEEKTVERKHGGTVIRQNPELQQAYSILYFGFTLLPIVAGLDKFFHFLVDWNVYLSPAFASLMGGNVALMMSVVGVIEIVAGILVAARPRLGSMIVAIWLWGIIINLLLIPGYYDIALRDFGLSLGALAFWRMNRALI